MVMFLDLQHCSLVSIAPKALRVEYTDITEKEACNQKFCAKW